jgi:hypothetical protein
MRDNGVSAFPDPDASGGLTIDGVGNGSSLVPSAPAWKQALGACQDLQPPGFMGDQEVSDEEREVRLEFAECRARARRPRPAHRTSGVQTVPTRTSDLIARRSSIAA